MRNAVISCALPLPVLLAYSLPFVLTLTHTALQYEVSSMQTWCWTRQLAVVGTSSNLNSKHLQDRVRELESEIEWVRAERQDAQQAAQREQKQAQARIKEAEDAASRAKAARRSVTTSFTQL